MSLLTVNNVKKEFNSEPIFEGISRQVQPAASRPSTTQKRLPRL